jgi:hypothetical protein
MTTIQLKEEIHKAVDKMPEKVLTELFEHIKSIQHKSPEHDKIDQIIDKIFEQEDNLLRRLAE